MHPYATDSSERKHVPPLLMGVSILLAYLLHWGLIWSRLTVPWWLDAPSTIGFYSLVHSSFDRWGWRDLWIRMLLGVKLPILAGKWRGHCTSSFDNHITQYEIEVTIRQNWRSLAIVLHTPTSSSFSLTAGIHVDDPKGIALTYCYMNEPKPGASAAMNTHSGTAHLVLDGDVMDGEYYSGRGRQNFGSIIIQRQRF